MRVISPSRLEEFWNDPKSPRGSQRRLEAWLALTEEARWHNFAELRATFQSADAVGDCVVFNVWGNRLRLVARVRYVSSRYRGGRVYVLRVMTHTEYDAEPWADDCGCHQPPPGPRPVQGDAE